MRLNSVTFVPRKPGSKAGKTFLGTIIVTVEATFDGVEVAHSVLLFLHDGERGLIAQLPSGGKGGRAVSQIDRVVAREMGGRVVNSIRKWMLLGLFDPRKYFRVDRRNFSAVKAKAALAAEKAEEGA